MIESTDFSFLEQFGLTVQEAVDLSHLARSTIDADKHVLSRRILARASPGTSTRIAQALRSVPSKSFSNAGQCALILLLRDNPHEIDSLESLLKYILVHPVHFRSVAVWCFQFALRDTATNLQLHHCQSPTSEAHLTGLLLGELSSSCRDWAQKAAGPLNRTGSTICIDRIDLSILGGEQATGGDFGLVLHFDDYRTPPYVQQHTSYTRIVPLIFQAKRYVRPIADVSQHHHVRGFQHSLLSGNECASAYIFYENGTGMIELPVPPLIKPVSKVYSPGKTVVLEDCLDLPGYMHRAMYDSSFAAAATSPEEALRMIYSKAHVGQLSTLAVISDSSNILQIYERALEELNRELRGRPDRDSSEGPER